MDESSNINRRIAETMVRAVNEQRYELFDGIMAEEFKDHHPGLGASESTRAAYVDMLKYCQTALQVRAELDLVFFRGPYTVVHGWMTGKHVGSFLGVEPSGQPVKWSFIEVYRIVDGRITERWSLDDLPGLLTQMGVKLPV